MSYNPGNSKPNIEPEFDNLKVRGRMCSDSGLVYIGRFDTSKIGILDMEDETVCGIYAENCYLTKMKDK